MAVYKGHNIKQVPIVRCLQSKIEQREGSETAARLDGE